MKYEPKGNLESVDHIDRDRLNNQRCNLRIASFRAQLINRGMQKNNKSKNKWVSYDEKGKRWRALWQEEEGKRITKSFALMKFGYDEAKRLAIEAREDISSLLHYREALNLDD